MMNNNAIQVNTDCTECCTESNKTGYHFNSEESITAIKNLPNSREVKNRISRFHAENYLIMFKGYDLSPFGHPHNIIFT